ncbi:hypothetical protein EOG37_01245 [Clavibacter michiganensis subsp. michiganensis]|jgi:hypothetical protein|uniref:hypothetical protein n=1 Tax=Clavibacter michiganensis TaxID=28447 RepID=UPI001C648AEA|nr:hypothetical protein [Clavibacter michiganensis]MBW8025305.1 hypothetical protein [Clavibacter michiganensis subsp. michiganensis]
MSTPALAASSADLIARVLDPFAGGWKTVPLVDSEDDLQEAIHDLLTAHGIESAREVRLSDGKSRIDLLAGSVGIEVKIDGSHASVLRQLTRYAACAELTDLILVTTRSKHHVLPATIGTTPVRCVSLIGFGL